MYIKNKYLKLIAIISIILLTTSGCTKFNTTNVIKDNNNSISINSKDKLLVHFIDVGQGDSTLIQINNKNLLVDGGGRDNSSNLVSYLKKQKVKRLDAIIATHPHEDHIGGLTEVIKEFEVSSFYAPKKTSTTAAFKDMVNALKSKNLKIISLKGGDTLNIDSEIKAQVLAPNSTNYENVNNYSVVLMLTYKNNSFLFEGDAEALSEKEILNKNYALSSSVIKIGHHGSRTSTTNEYLKAVNPKIAVISCGKNNDYKHPHKETLSKLSKINCTLYRTDLEGTIVLVSDGTNIYRKK